jgi:protein-L-isoaspartate(D-aspartate) O-methyltransferase
MRRPTLLALTIFVATVACAAPTQAQDARGDERSAMIEVIEAHARFAPTAVENGKLDPAVLQVMRTVPRHEFVPAGVRVYAYQDRPLPIGYGQTISQPFIVALMTHLLELDRGEKVLEIGTGSGYQAAVLSPLAERVFSIEIVPELSASASEALKRLDFANVETRVGDGYYGWPEEAPFDAIIVTAAASQVPPPLVKQLKAGGRMVIPIGGPFYTQQLMLVEKGDDARITTHQLLPVQFVPLARREAK